MDNPYYAGWCGRQGEPISARRSTDYAVERAEILRRIEDLERRFAHLAEEMKK